MLISLIITVLFLSMILLGIVSDEVNRSRMFSLSVLFRFAGLSVISDFIFSISLLGLWLKFKADKFCYFFNLKDYWLLKALFSHYPWKESHSFKSSRDILFLSSTSKHFLIKSFISAERGIESRKRTGIFVIFYINSFSVRHYQGVVPCSNS